MGKKSRGALRGVQRDVDLGGGGREKVYPLPEVLVLMFHGVRQGWETSNEGAACIDRPPSSVQLALAQPLSTYGDSILPRMQVTTSV